ncbi:WW domain binding protein WBP-2, contains GRAM domain [Handroanthus impetiginosus]|uniref:WW domain binding protein WBP-2, contains GRAM domain n=1 Tax=Handroanthus impetiginosus TaxID=429701 RepID=A0A2G9H8X9_9LAMI|nr:WW domain binding protein WBP-2, contains GRAM domain [Handroanthus impetiginosus]
MALNPQLFPNGMPVPFINEIFVLARDGVEFEIDKIPGAQGGNVKAKGTIYLSNIRMVFVANKPVGNFVAFDMPLLYVHDEKFNQPIFFCNNISGRVDPVVPDNEHRALYSTHSFKILFKDGGCGTFVPLFFNLIGSVRQYSHHASAPQPRVDPLQAAQTPVDEMMRHAYVDPNDPTKIFLQQPNPEQQLRRRTYHSHDAGN